MKQIVLVTSNEHKYHEMKAIIGAGLARVDLDVPEIQSMDLAEVVKAKAEAAFQFVQQSVLVEDVGIDIKAWNGLPGPLIKWFNQTIRPAGIARLLRAEKDRRAIATAILDLYDGEQHQLFTGEVEGQIVDEPRGDNGFGFDFIFAPLGSELTFAEMSLVEKNALSHRALALRRFKDAEVLGSLLL